MTWRRGSEAALAGCGVGHGRQPGKTARRHHRSLPWRARPGVAGRGGGRRAVFRAIAIGLRPSDRRPTLRARRVATRMDLLGRRRSGVSVPHIRSRREGGGDKSAAGDLREGQSWPERHDRSRRCRRGVLPRRPSCWRSRYSGTPIYTNVKTALGQPYCSGDSSRRSRPHRRLCQLTRWPPGRA